MKLLKLSRDTYTDNPEFTKNTDIFVNPEYIVSVSSVPNLRRASDRYNPGLTSIELAGTGSIIVNKPIDYVMELIGTVAHAQPQA